MVLKSFTLLALANALFNVPFVLCKTLDTSPVLLWWTNRLFPHWGTNTEEIPCSKGTCISTTSRHYFVNGTVHGFIFYGTDLDFEDMPLPRNRHHIWALFHEESPMNNYAFSHPEMIQLFNYTATFRRTSNFPLTTQFITDLNYLTTRKPVPLHTKNYLKTSEKLAPIVYLQSHCNVPSDRDRYVEELAKYMHVDSYGQCLHNRDLPEELRSTEQYDSDNFLDFIARYKFHLAFENAICDDYMTEKLFRPLHVGSVPVYRGSPLVKDWLPSPKSAIVVDDYESPKALADFITSLDTNDAEYELHLSYKESSAIENKLLTEALVERKWGINDPNQMDFLQAFECYICDQLLDHIQTAREGLPTGVKIALNSHMGCPQPEVSIGNLNEVPKNDEWLQQEWINQYWYSRDLALSLKQLIKNGSEDSKDIHHYAYKIRNEL